MREILFGVPWMETGIRRFFVRTRQRTITYAVTLVLKRYDPQMIASLTAALRERYPTSPFKINVDNSTGEEIVDAVKQQRNITHLFFDVENSISHYVPLLISYVFLFSCVYFSVRKIDIIKNKWALALGSVFTVILSLLMSIGICIWLEFNMTLNRTDILPYIGESN